VLTTWITFVFLQMI